MYLPEANIGVSAKCHAPMGTSIGVGWTVGTELASAAKIETLKKVQGDNTIREFELNTKAQFKIKRSLLTRQVVMFMQIFGLKQSELFFLISDSQ